MVIPKSWAETKGDQVFGITAFWTLKPLNSRIYAGIKATVYITKVFVLLFHVKSKYHRGGYKSLQV